MTVRETNRAIKLVKDVFERKIGEALNLDRVSAPVLVRAGSGLNDDLSGVEKPVSFFAKACGYEVEIVQSLAKWKRMALFEYGYDVGEGIYTDMNAIRPDDATDCVHSIYVDQWDWERVIKKDERNVEFLKGIVQKIVNAVVDTLDIVKELRYIDCNFKLNRDVFFITSEELLRLYPSLNAKQREYEIVKEKGTVFLMQIGMPLSNGLPHDSRSPDYDDFSLNGDLLFYHKGLDIALEISSMGIRVDSNSLKNQLTLTNNLDRLKYEYHQRIINDALPLTIGGGIGQSRLCLLLLNLEHIAQVQASVWPQSELKALKDKGIEIL